MIDFTTIKNMASAYPGTEESTSYGTPAIKVGKKLILRLHQKEDAIVLMLESVEEQQSLIAADPMSFFITDHYDGYAAVLVRPTVEIERLQPLIEAAWRRLAKKSDIAEYDQT